MRRTSQPYKHNRSRAAQTFFGNNASGNDGKAAAMLSNRQDAIWRAPYV